MQEKELKTSLGQRIIIGVIAVLLLSSTVAIYALIVLNGEKNKQASSAKKEELALVTKDLTTKQDELKAVSTKLSQQYFNTLASFRNKIKAYNGKSVEDAGLKTFDLKTDTGAEITDKTTTYYTYYVGWCANESVFDSSFDDAKNPKSLKEPLAVTNPKSLIAGWSEGIKGMRFGGVREVDIPSPLAYGKEREICGGKNSPLKFLILPIEVSEEYKKLSSEYNQIYIKYRKLQSEINKIGA